MLRKRARAGCLLICCLCAAAGAQAQQPSTPNVTSPSHYHMLLGYVVGAGGAALAGASLQLHDTHGTLIESGVTGDSGQFQFWTNASGPYELEVDWNHQMATVSTSGSGTVRVPISGDETAARSLHAEPAVSANDLAAPEKARAKLAAALKALAKPDLNHAFELANEALRIDPEWGRAYYVRGLIAYQRKNPAEAESDLSVALQHDPSYAPSYVTLASIDIDTGRLDEAESNLRHALALPPVMWQAYYAMAALDLDAGRFADAEHMALEAANDPAAPAECHFIAAESERQQKNIPEALRQYRAYLAAHPQSARQASIARQRLTELDPSQQIPR